MRVRPMLGVYAVLALMIFPCVTQAGYSWPIVSPADGATDVGQPISFGAEVNWTMDDNPLLNGYVEVTVVGYAGSKTVTFNYTTDTFVRQGLFTQGTVTFNPPLAAGTEVEIKFEGRYETSGGVIDSSSKTIKFRVKAS